MSIPPNTDTHSITTSPLILASLRSKSIPANTDTQLAPSNFLLSKVISLPENINYYHF